MTKNEQIKRAMKTAARKGHDPYNSHTAMAKAFKEHARREAARNA